MPSILSNFGEFEHIRKSSSYISRTSEHSDAPQGSISTFDPSKPWRYRHTCRGKTVVYCRKCDLNVNAVAGKSRACKPDFGCWWAVCLTGCQVSGPWETGALDGLSELVQDLRLCSQALNKLDRQALKQSWNGSTHNVIDQNSKWLLSATAPSWGEEFWLTTHWGRSDVSKRFKMFPFAVQVWLWCLRGDASNVPCVYRLSVLYL